MTSRLVELAARTGMLAALCGLAFGCASAAPPSGRDPLDGGASRDAVVLPVDATGDVPVDVARDAASDALSTPDAAAGAACVPLDEICNYADDDCDGACDEGVGDCRVAVHRAYGPGGHLYTTASAEASCCGNTVEALEFFYLFAVAVDDTQPLFRCRAGAARFLTVDGACEGVGILDGPLGYIGTTERCGTVPLYRLRHPMGDNFYTHSSDEVRTAVALGYENLGAVGYVPLAP
jgi:hypothetical protein